MEVVLAWRWPNSTPGIGERSPMMASEFFPARADGIKTGPSPRNVDEGPKDAASVDLLELVRGNDLAASHGSERPPGCSVDGVLDELHRPIAQKRTVVVPGSVRAQPATAKAARAGSAQRRRRSIQFGTGLLPLPCVAVGIVFLFLRGSRA